MTMRQGLTKLLSAGSIALLAVVALGYTRTGEVAAQNNGNPSILAAVQSVQSTVDSLQGAVTALQESVDALAAPDQGKVRWTPSVRVTNEGIGCAVVNISDQTRTVRLQMLGGTGFDDSFTLGPGTNGSIISGSTNGNFFCKFTVVNGTAADIRGAISVNNATGQKFAVAAQ